MPGAVSEPFDLWHVEVAVAHFVRVQIYSAQDFAPN
jgi:hypothetical protein